MMRPAHLREMSEADMTIGAHTVSHAFLPNLGEDEASEELVRGKEILEEALGSKVEHLAYPGSSGVDANFNDKVKRLTAKAGYRSAVTTERGAVSGGADALGLPRKFISGQAGVAGLAIRLEDHRFPLRQLRAMGSALLSH